MRSLFPILLCLVAIYIYSCANQGTPTGGPRDTIPPLLIESTPANKSINYKSKEFHFVFDERIDASKIKQKLVITPFTENKYKHRIKKNELFIEFEEDFEDSTTYTFNFADGVVDVTEKNSVENFILAFSTGPYIDSISISGTIRNLYNNKKVDKATVTLYDVSDTLNILTGKPRYFAKTDTSGTYKIENIKNSYYQIYAFEDKNNNLTNQPDEETQGFIKDSIDLNSNKENIDLAIQLLNINDLKMIRAKKTGQYFDVLYNKYIQSYQMKKLDSMSKLPLPKSNLIKERTTLRYYYDSAYQYEKDSLAVIIQTTDTVYNHMSDTVYVQFSESKRKPEKFNSSLLPRDQSNVDEKFNMIIRFTKPITEFYRDSMILQYDTLYKQNIPDSILQWNEDMTELVISNQLNKNFFKHKVDSLLNLLTDSTHIPQDSSAIDTVKVKQVNYLTKIKTNQVYYLFKKGTFISIDLDTAEQQTRFYQFKNPENYGIVSGQVETTNPSYTLQLVDKDYKVIAQKKNPTKFIFNYVKPGKYTFRVLIDKNEDQTWTHGNLNLQMEPEPIYFYPEEFDIRANWEIENILISF
ncbi:Ig-like domain-containing protein [Reichenbachiella agarivorans]|uniref:Ig-like domain-containing protein n=1 Tax=Reichenbachiella agarivorans TaxID=2979464 RepID=A0ABY6CSV6_9BACT|nr:Ig-like domain-containing protein [Reichenbachiella agarivorans]UXP33424.1 Ig-like domain-containing protein [Reichenbachiella agarivorans]